MEDAAIPPNAWSVLGMPLWVTLPAERTGGRLTLLEHLADPGYGPPLHMHALEDEMFHILAGRFLVQLGDSRTELGAGESAWLPRGVPHTWKCVGDSPGRFLFAVTPSGFEHFFRLIHEERLEMPRDEARLSAMTERFGLSFVGPPL
jgi:quercetin dioxygenase-like cupin family protein